MVTSMSGFFPSRPSRPSCLSYLSCLSSIVFILTAATSFAQPPHDSHAMPSLSRELVERPLPLRTGVGTAHDVVSTRNPQAQAYYDQGLALLHSYVWLEAARSFHQALRLDPKLAIADVGLSYAWVELNAPGEAHAALDRARVSAAAASDHDRRHIALRASQMAAEDAPADTAKLAAYRKALDEALIAFPQDQELWLLRGLAESSDPAERGQGSRREAVRFFERARAIAPAQFAAQHYLAHAYENAGRTGEALARASEYARMAPQVPHARHMLGHELRRTGKIALAIAEFEAADRMEAEYVALEKIPPALNWHYHHNLDLLAMSYRYVGRDGKAEELPKKSFGLPSNTVEQELNKREWPAFLLAKGRADEALQAADVMRSHSSPLVRAMGDVIAGEARMAMKQPKAGRRSQRGAAADAGVAGRRRSGGAVAAPAARRAVVVTRRVRKGTRDVEAGRDGGPRGARARCVGQCPLHTRVDRSRRHGCRRR